MQPAKNGRRDDVTIAAFGAARYRWVTREGLVWALVVVVLRVLAKDLEEMVLAESEDVVRALTADRADQALHECVLPRRPGGTDDLLDPHLANGLAKQCAIDAVSIAVEIGGDGRARKCLLDLMRGPPGSGIRGDVDMQDHAAVVGEDHEAVAPGVRVVAVFGEGRGAPVQDVSPG